MSSSSASEAESSGFHLNVEFLIGAGSMLAAMLLGAAVPIVIGLVHGDFAITRHAMKHVAEEKVAAAPPARKRMPVAPPATLVVPPATPAVTHSSEALPRAIETPRTAVTRPAVAAPAKEKPRRREKPTALAKNRAAPRAKARALSIDERYDKAVAAECRRGISGLICREKVKWRLCKGRWNNARPEPGETRCYFARHGDEP